MRILTLIRRLGRLLHDDHHKMLSAEVFAGGEWEPARKVIDVRRTKTGDVILKLAPDPLASVVVSYSLDRPFRVDL